MAEESALRASNKEALARKQTQLHYLDVINHRLSFSAASSPLSMTDGQRSYSRSPNTQLPRLSWGGLKVLRDAKFLISQVVVDSPLGSLRRGVCEMADAWGWRSDLCSASP